MDSTQLIERILKTIGYCNVDTCYPCNLYTPMRPGRTIMVCDPEGLYDFYVIDCMFVIKNYGPGKDFKCSINDPDMCNKIKKYLMI